MVSEDGSDHAADHYSGEDCARLDQLFSTYLDRLNAGEQIDPLEIIASHPEEGEEIVADLEAFLRLRPATHERQDSSLGTIGDYTLRRRIGRGGMGVVYEAWENSMDRPVALKVLPSAVAAEQRTFLRFCREARLAGKLHHPNIVGVFGMGIKGDTPHYAMELVKGETLAQVVAKWKNGPADAGAPFAASREEIGFYSALAKAFAGVADGLQQAHAQGIIHRDIKPSNLILDGTAIRDGDIEDRLRILDFGLARLEGQESLTLSGDLLGTVFYMSPEQATARRVPVDRRTDIYSLGATLYEMLTRKPPFQGQSREDTLSEIILREPPAPRRLNPRVPPDLDTIVQKCMRKDPADRYSSAEALAQDLRRFVRGEPVEARPETRLEKLARKVRRHRAALFAGAVLCILLAGLAWLLVARSIEEDRAMRAAYDKVVLDAAESLYRDQLFLSAGELGNLATFRGRNFQGGGQGGKEERTSTQETLRDLEQMAAAVPDRPDASYYLARIHRLLGENEAALEAIDRVLEAAPDFAPAEVLREEISGKRSPVGDQALEEILRHYHDTHEWQEPWLLAYTHFRDRRWQEAAEAYGRLLAYRAEKGTDPYIGFAVEAYMGRGLSRLRSDDFEGAIRDFSGARGFWPRFAEAGLLVGKAFYEKGDHEEAERVFQELHSESPPEARSELAVWIAFVSRTLGDRRKGEAWIERADEPERLFAWAFVHFFEGKLEQSAEECRELLDLDPQNVLAQKKLASTRLYLQRDRYGPAWDREREELLAVAVRGVRNMPNRTEASYFKFAVLLAMDRLEEARTEAEHLMTLHYQEGGLHSGLAHLARVLLLREEGRLDEAEEYFHRAIGDGRGNKLFGKELARILEEAGKLSVALLEYEWLAEHHPTWACGWAGAARVHNRLERHEDAEALARKAVGLFPRNTSGYGTLAYALYKQGRFEQAITVADEGLLAVPGRVEPYLARGLAQESLGDPAAAARSFCEALELHPEYIEAHEAMAALVARHDTLHDLPEFRRLADRLAARAPSSRRKAILERTVSVLRGRAEAEATNPASPQE
jgi:tetratricopeptide (TPR) repeat protein/tRNA A-37 threonylcarbamoyl transferase component Bud32